MKFLGILLFLIVAFLPAKPQPMGMKNNNLISEASPLSSMDWNPSTDIQSLFFFSNESMSFPDRKASWLVVLILIDILRSVRSLHSKSYFQDSFMKS